MPGPCSGGHRMDFYEVLSDSLPNLAGIEVCFGLLHAFSLWQEKRCSFTNTTSSELTSPSTASYALSCFSLQGSLANRLPAKWVHGLVKLADQSWLESFSSKHSAMFYICISPRRKVGPVLTSPAWRMTKSENVQINYFIQSLQSDGSSDMVYLPRGWI